MVEFVVLSTTVPMTLCLDPHMSCDIVYYSFFVSHHSLLVMLGKAFLSISVSCGEE